MQTLGFMVISGVRMRFYMSASGTKRTDAQANVRYEREADIVFKIISPVSNDHQNLTLK